MFNLRNLFFPENYTCVICSMDIFNDPYFVCDDCKKNLPYITNNVCLHCGEPLVSDGYYCKRCKGKKFIYDRAIAPFMYTGSVVGFVRGLKYNNKKYYAKPMAKFMTDCFVNSKLYADYIIPVPICVKRLKERGFNQSELIATEISKILNIKIKCDNLKRIKETPSQTNFDYKERQVNLKDAFKVYKVNELKDKTILLIDDVYTTGATINECSKILKKAGVKCIYVLTFAHTIFREE